jgi:hypothetical protein
LSRAPDPAFLASLEEGIGRAMRQLLDQELAPLEARLAAIESRPAMTDKGVWSPNVEYLAGDVVSDRSALWTAKVRCKGLMPGDGGLGWRLILKSPRGKQ